MNNVTDLCALGQRSQTIVNQTTDRAVFDSQDKTLVHPGLSHPPRPQTTYFVSHSSKGCLCLYLREKVLQTKQEEVLQLPREKLRGTLWYCWKEGKEKKTRTYSNHLRYHIILLPGRSR